MEGGGWTGVSYGERAEEITHGSGVGGARRTTPRTKAERMLGVGLAKGGTRAGRLRRAGSSSSMGGAEEILEIEL